MGDMAYMKFELPSDLDAETSIVQVGVSAIVADMLERIVFDDKDAV
jgi:hypothetical protein